MKAVNNIIHEGMKTISREFERTIQLAFEMAAIENMTENPEAQGGVSGAQLEYIMSTLASDMGAFVMGAIKEVILEPDEFRGAGSEEEKEAVQESMVHNVLGTALNHIAGEVASKTIGTGSMLRFIDKIDVKLIERKGSDGPCGDPECTPCRLKESLSNSSEARGAINEKVASMDAGGNTQH